jgi:hypothetical protein
MPERGATEAPVLDSFRGDFANLAALIRESWGENRDQSLNYDEAFLRSAFEYPRTRFDLAPTLYQDDRPVAFVGGFPRRVLLHGQPRNLLCLTFWTAASSCKGQGFGSRVWIEALNRARSNGFDGVVHFCAEAAVSNAISLACADAANAFSARVQSVRYLARMLRPGNPGEPPERWGNVDPFLAAANLLSPDLRFRRLWSRDEAEWQCLRRAGALYTQYQSDSRVGALTAYVVDSIGPDPTRFALLDDILWGSLLPPERMELVRRFLAQAEGRNAAIAIAPVAGYAETDTLRSAGFRLTRRVLNMYLTLWDSMPEPLEAAYMDVY